MAQRYVSKHLHHFVGRSLSNDDQRFDLLLQIIKSGWLTPPPHRKNEPFETLFRPADVFDEYELINPKVVCFGDIPVNDLALHMGKYGTFGISFKKEFLILNGASPVLYMPRNSVQNFLCTDGSEQIDPSHPDPYEAHSDYVREHGYLRSIPRRDLFNQWYKSFFHVHKYLLETNFDDINNPEHKKLVEVLEPLVLGFTPHILSLVKTYDENLDEFHEDNYYMEREWRILGSLKFTIEDIDKVFIPQAYARRLRSELSDYYGEVIFADNI